MADNDIPPQNNINFLLRDKFKVQFSNIPTVNKYSNLAFLYEQKIQDLTIPNYDLEFLSSNLKNRVIWTPISKSNDDLSDLLITFLVDENFINYYNLFEFIQELRFGQIRRESPETASRKQTKANSYIKNYHIDSINLQMLDSQKRVTKIISFEGVFISSLSSLNLDFASKGENVSFSVNFKFTDMFINSPPSEN